MKKLFYKFYSIYENYRWNKYKNLKIGRNTLYSKENLDGLLPQLVTIGNDCIFAPKSVVLTHDASLLAVTGKYFFSPVVIGDRVFIGYGAVIMPGVEIGDDVIIGSNSVVTKNIESNSVVVGTPAKYLCSTEELKMKRSPYLTEAPYDWRNSVSNRDILQLQKMMGVLND